MGMGLNMYIFLCLIGFKFKYPKKFKMLPSYDKVMQPKTSNQLHKPIPTLQHEAF